MNGHYQELSKDLRYCSKAKESDCLKCRLMIANGNCGLKQMIYDAANAIDHLTNCLEFQTGNADYWKTLYQKITGGTHD